MSELRRYHITDLTPADRAAMADLVRELGHNADDIAATIAVTADEIGTRLHLTQYLRDEFGMIYIDVAADHPVSRPHVHDIDPRRLPAAIRPA